LGQLASVASLLERHHGNARSFTTPPFTGHHSWWIG